MSHRGSDASSMRRSSVPELMRRHSSLLASLTTDAGRVRRRSERRQSASDLEREFPNLRPTPRTSTCQSIPEEEPPSLSQEELEQLLENCTKLTRDNQLTEGRLWGLTLPEHMPELARHNADPAAFNFQKVSFGLDAAVQIYSKRVDSMLNAALDTRSRLTTQQKQKDAEPAVEEDLEITARSRARRGSDFGGDVTLASNLDIRAAKGDAEESVQLDPLFGKTAALFDLAGFKGLPTLNLGIRRGGCFVLDMTEMPDPVVSGSGSLAPDFKLDLGLFGVCFEMPRDVRPVMPSSAKLYRLLGRPEQNASVRDLIQRGMNAVKLPPPEHVLGMTGENPELPDSPGIAQANGHIEPEIECDENTANDAIHGDTDSLASPVWDAEIQEFSAIDEPGRAGPSDLWKHVGVVVLAVENGELSPRLDAVAADPPSFAFDVSASLAEGDPPMNVLDEEMIEWLLDAKFDRGANKGRAWTGAAHWKYPQTSSKLHSSRDLAPASKRKETRAVTLDFTDLPDVDLEKFKKAERENSITVTFKEGLTHLLPTDHRYDASCLLQLPLFPRSQPQHWISRIRAKDPERGGDPDVFSALGDFPDIDTNQDWNQALPNEASSFDLIQAPPQIIEDTSQVELLPSHVHMGQLKSTLWTKIETFQPESEIPLDQITHGISDKGDVSFGTCFACLLHLAVEHEFEIVNTSTGKATVVLTNPSA